MNRIFILTISLIYCLQVFGQTGEDKSISISLDEAIARAREKSVQALEAKNAFVSTYWAYRAYQASRLPSLFLYGNLMNYNRSIVLLQSYEDGSLKYLSASNLQNSLGLQISQNISFTGGTLKLYSDLSRIDQFGNDRSMTWYSQPMTLSYTQPLFAYNQFKWDKLIEPKNYETGCKKYLESMEDISLRTAEAYYDLLKAYKELEIKRNSRANTQKMFEIASERLKTGSVSKSDCLQIELKILTDSLAVNEGLVTLRQAQMTLNSLLGYDASLSIRPIYEDNLPAIILDYENVVALVLANSGFKTQNEIKLLEAMADVAKAKASRNISINFNARFGLTQNAPDFPGAYRNPLDQEVVGMGFSVPIYDWGLGKGKVQKAIAALEVVKAQTSQSENDLKRQIFNSVGQFNYQRSQCLISKRAAEIAEERYYIVIERFRNAGASVTELTDAQQDRESSSLKYIEDQSNFWKFYYSLRKLTLYDFISGTNIDVQFEEMIN